jgi:hypothetical protein
MKYDLTQRKEEENKLIQLMMNKSEDKERKSSIVKKFMRTNTKRFQNAA